jgi:hypothetical protein
MPRNRFITCVPNRAAPIAVSRPKMIDTHANSAAGRHALTDTVVLTDSVVLLTGPTEQYRRIVPGVSQLGGDAVQAGRLISRVWVSQVHFAVSLTAKMEESLDTGPGGVVQNDPGYVGRVDQSARTGSARALGGQPYTGKKKNGRGRANHPHHRARATTLTPALPPPAGPDGSEAVE